MRKNRISGINSYTSYKQTQVRNIKSLLVISIWVTVLLVAYLTGRLQVDIDTFLLDNGIKWFGYGDSKLSNDISLSQSEICYDLYQTCDRVKGIYIPASKADQIESYIKMAEQTQINSFIIDVKNDYGNLTFASDNEYLLSQNMVLTSPPIKDISYVVRRMKEAGIYPIARIVAFKDNVHTRVHPECAMQSVNHTVYQTSAGDRWLNPYDKDNWTYILEVCKEAHKMGFEEIQFDYVRFHESMDEDRVILQEDTSKIDIITEFTQYICEHLHKEGMKVSADVFGAVVLSDIDAQIVGQDFVKMSEYLDYISPMIYPSHYAEGTFGIKYPHIDAYDVILKTMNMGQKKLQSQSSTKVAEIRPWLQDFTLVNKKPYLKYGPEQIQEQIKGVEDAAGEGWIFWNAAGKYTQEGLMVP